MQEEPVEAVRPALGRARAVDPVARDGMPDGIEVDPDLVRPPGDEVELEQGPAGEPLADAVAGHGRPAVGDDTHPGPVPRVAPDGRFDPTGARGHLAVDQRLVRLLDPARLELGHQRRLRGILLGDHQQTARVLVQAVDDARALDTGDPAPRRAVAVGQEGVDQRPVRMTGGRVDDQAGRLVDDQQVVVLVDDVEDDLGRGSEVERDRIGHLEAQLRARGDDRVRLEELTGGGQPAVGDELLDVAPRQARSRPRRSDRPARPSRPGRAAGGSRSWPAAQPPERSSTMRATPGTSARPKSMTRAALTADVGDVERVPAEPADPDVHEVDDVAEPQPVDHVAERAAEEQPEGDREVQAPPGVTVIPDDQGDDADRDEAEQDRLVVEQPEERARVLAEDEAHVVTDDRDDLARTEVGDQDRLGDLVEDQDGDGQTDEDRPLGPCPG